MHALVEALEAANPLPAPAQSLAAVAGDWRLLYSTIVITGVKKTKLGLREFVQLGDFVQTIDVAAGRAVNRVEFSVAGLGSLAGALTVTARFEVAGPARVAIAFKRSELEPAQLQTLFRANFDLLLSIFNPDGWLDITFVDADMRVGRDDKGNVFLLERMPPPA